MITATPPTQEIGDVDILINNAGIVTGKPFLESSDEMIELSMKACCPGGQRFSPALHCFQEGVVGGSPPSCWLAGPPATIHGQNGNRPKSQVVGGGGRPHTNYAIFGIGHP